MCLGQWRFNRCFLKLVAGLAWPFTIWWYSVRPERHVCGLPPRYGCFWTSCVRRNHIDISRKYVDVRGIIGVPSCIHTAIGCCCTNEYTQTESNLTNVLIWGRRWRMILWNDRGRIAIARVLKPLMEWATNDYWIIENYTSTISIM